MFDYKSDWQRFTYPDSLSHFASKSDVEAHFSKVWLAEDDISHSGPPLLVDGSKAVVNDETEHWIVFGETGSKKTRCFIKPLIPILAKAGESMFITDVKGELSIDPRIRNILSQKGYKQVFLDFRNFSADSLNLFENAINLYLSGQTDKAMANVVRIISALSSKYKGLRADPYWNILAEMYMVAVVRYLLEICTERSEMKSIVNMLSLSSFCNTEGSEALKTLLEHYYSNIDNSTIMNLKSIVSTPEKTQACILSTANSFFKDLLVQDDLMSMLSTSSFNVEDMYDHPVCVFIILPDETSAYNDIAGILMDVLYSRLIEYYTYKQKQGSATRRINWLCDEFSNIRINDMKAKISASRGRNMRWFIVSQSLKQLNTVYPEDAATIIGNCKNTVFLQSSDPEMVQYISDLCGKTNITDDPLGEPLLPPESLKKLRKSLEYKEAIYIRDDLIYKASLPDIDQYIFLKKYETRENVSIPRQKSAPVMIYSPGRILSDISKGVISVPFYPKHRKEEKSNININSNSNNSGYSPDVSLYDLFGTF